MLSWVIDEAVQRALAEDVGKGDLTSDALYSGRCPYRRANLQQGLRCFGWDACCQEGFERLDPVEIKQELKDGSLLAPGSVIARIRGKGRAILTRERTALNFLQRLSEYFQPPPIL